ncbi:hypothetical protein GCM10027443_26120 [Pontibacter brevis]
MFQSNKFFLLALGCFFGLQPQLSAQIVRPLSAPVNDPAASEISPSLSSDGQTLIFLSDRLQTGEFRIYESNQLASDRWSPPKLIQGDINEINTIDAAFLGYDGSTIYFHSSSERDNVGVEDISFIHKQREGWGKPENVGAPVNSPGFDGQPSITADDTKLFFVRKGKSPNCRVMMMAVKGKDDKWLAPIEMPTSINQYCVQTPRILPDGNTLLFASDRPGGKGGYDIYLSKWQPESGWSEPQNLEWLNTPEDDLSPAYSIKDNIIIYQSGRDMMQGSLPADQHLLQQTFSIIKGITKDEVSGKPNASGIIVKERKGTQRPQHTTSSADGMFTLVLRNGYIYDVEANSEAFNAEKKEINLTSANTHQFLTTEIKQLPEIIELQYQFSDSLFDVKIKPALTIYSPKEQKAVPVAYDPKLQSFTAKVKLQHNYYIEASLEGYPALNEHFYLEDVKSYIPVRKEKVLRRQRYKFVFKPIDRISSRPMEEVEFAIMDTRKKSPLFPDYDPETNEYRVELDEQGSYKVTFTAEGYKPVEKVIESLKFIRENKLKQEILMEPNF